MDKNRRTGIFQHTGKYFQSFIDLWNIRNILRPGNIRIGYLQYFFALPLALTFIITQSSLLTENSRVFGLSSTILTFISFACGAALMFFIRSTHNIHIVSKISSVLTLVAFIPWLFLHPDSSPAFICALLFMAGAGCCMANSSSFMMILNNAERFFGCVLMTLCISLVRINSDFIRQHTCLRAGIITILVSGISICMLTTRKEDFSDSNKGKFNEFHPSIWLSLYILLSFFAIEVLSANTRLIDMRLSMPLMNILALAPVLLCIVIQLIFSRSVWVMCNVFFIAAILSNVMIFTHNSRAAFIFAEIKEIGLLVGFYLCACVVNKFCDFRRHKIMEFVCIFILGAIYIIAKILLPAALAFSAAVIVSAVLFVLFLLLSPAFSQYLFSADWSLQFVQLHMSELKARITMAKNRIESEETALTPEEKNDLLTPGETDVAMLLIEGESRNSISRRLHRPIEKIHRDIDAIREKVIRRGDPDPGIAAAVRKFELTRRETDLLRCICRRMTNAGIAADLFISGETVKSHMRSLLKKLPVENRTEVPALIESLRKNIF